MARDQIGISLLRNRDAYLVVTPDGAAISEARDDEFSLPAMETGELDE